MEASWNLCAPPIQPIVLSKNSDSIANNDGQMPMTPLMLDALNSSPNSIDCNEKPFVTPQRRASASYETAYLNNQHHQYSVQGSTSTPNSVGLSSGTASPDVSTQHTNDSTSFQNCNDAKWNSLNDSCPPIQDKPTRYCYVFQPPTLSTMSDSTSIMSNLSAHSTITVPTSSIVPAATFTSTPSTQALVTIGSPFQTNSLPAPSKPSLIERSSSVPLQNTLSSNQEPTIKTTDFSSLEISDADQKTKKPKKRKSSDTEPTQPVKKPSTNKEPVKAPSKPQISALTRRRLKTAEKSGEPLEKMHLLLTELTVEDLKIICRKYNLPISGTKSDLLRRLQPLEEQIDVEAILLEAMQEEDRLNEEKAKEEEKQNESAQFNKNPPVNKPNSKTVSIDNIPTVKIPLTACNGTNQFDVAISNYLLQHRKQLNQQSHTVTLKPAAECMDGTCSCIIQKPGFPTAKTIYFAPSTVLNGTAPKTTVIRVPIASFNPTVDTSAPSAVLSKKLCKLDTSQCNGPATTFSYAEMGSGGQFTLETSPVKSADPTATIPKFVQISVPSTFCTGVNKDVHGGAATACLKCKENQPKETDGTDELQALINELSLDQINGAIENSTLTARILGLHQQTIKAQYSKLYQMGKLIGNSQKVLQCQQGKIEAARKAMLKIKANKPASIDTITKKLDISQLKEQHNQQTNELKSIQDNHQKLKSVQENLAKLEFQLQEELSIEQAVEDVVRLIKTNRKTALLIVQLVHKFQCERMREINRIATKKQEVGEKPINCPDCNGEQKCNCIKNQKEQRTPIENPTPAIVTLDESDDEHQKRREGEEDPSNLAKTPSKKKSKTAAKRNNKPVTQHSEHTFSEVMESIFSTVISNDGPLNDPNEGELGENLPEKLAALIESEERLQKAKSKSSSKPTKTVEAQNALAKVEKTEPTFTYSTPNQPEHPINTPVAQDQSTFNNGASDSNPSSLTLAQPPMPHKFERLPNDENSMNVDHSFAHPNCAAESIQTPALYNYMTSTTVTKSEINAVYTVNNSYNQQLPYADNRPGNAAYHQRRAFLQQKRQTLYEQLEHIERQQLHNEMQNSTYMCNSIDIDEELANLGDLNVEDLYNYDFDQLDVPTPIDETPPAVPFNGCAQPPQYMSQYQHPQFHNHSHPTSGFLAPEPLGHNQQQQQQDRHYSNGRTFQHANSVDFEDVLDLIRNGEKNRQPSMDFECEAQATNAIYQDLRLNDIDEMSWNDPLAVGDEQKQVAVNEN